MPNDAKLGLIVGVALVLLIAAVFFRRDSGMDPHGNQAFVHGQGEPKLPPIPRADPPFPSLPPLPKVDSDLPPLPPLPDAPVNIPLP